VTYSIVARDPETGHMGVATQSQAFAVGSSVPWALAGHGVIATQSMGEPMYGELGLDALRGGLTATEALTALRSVDPHPERRQVAMIDTRGGIEVYTGAACVEAAGHRIGKGCAALANMVAAPAVWEAMVETFESTTGPLAHRMLAALHAAEAQGGDFRGRRSAAIVVVRDRRTGRPWRDQVVDLRVEAHDDPVAELERLVKQSDRYHQMVEAFQCALDDDCDRALAILEQMDAEGPVEEPDLLTWRAVVLARAGRTADASAILTALSGTAPQFVEAIRRFGPAGLLGDPELLRSILPG
jgi:uncharacterized Ntn-hydrolase superfamily protein